MQENKGQHQGDDHAQLVDGHHLGRLAHLQSLVVAQPGGAGSQAREDKEKPALPADPRDAALAAGEKHHTPGHKHNHHGADGRGQVGIYTVNADLRQNRGECREHGGQQCEHKPHHNHPLLYFAYYEIGNRSGPCCFSGSIAQPFDIFHPRGKVSSQIKGRCTAPFCRKNAKRQNRATRNG